MSPTRRVKSTPASSLVGGMTDLWNVGRFGDSAALYDSSPERRDTEAVLLRARIALWRCDTTTATALLERVPRGREPINARCLAVLAFGYAITENLRKADEIFEEAASIAKRSDDTQTAGFLAYFRSQRFLLERRTDEARALLPQARSFPGDSGPLLAVCLESSVLDQEGRHREQVRLLMEMLQRINPNTGEQMMVRAWATCTLALLAREMFLPEALPEVERQLGGTPWPSDFNEQRFQSVRAMGWACALRGDYFNAFRYLRQCSRFATSDAWRAVAAAERAELARCKDELLWSRQELAEAEEFAATVNWSGVKGDERLGLLLLADLLVPMDTARAAHYRAQFDAENVKTRSFHFYADDPRLRALAQYSSGVVDLAIGHEKQGLDALRRALAIFQQHGYDWRAGRCALKLFETTRNASDLALASEHLRHYMNSWLGDELRRLSERKVSLPPMQRRVYESLCRGLSNAEIARELGRSEFTVRNHIKLIFKAFGVNSRAELIAKSKH